MTLKEIDVAMHRACADHKAVVDSAIEKVKASSSLLKYRKIELQKNVPTNGKLLAGIGA